MSSTKKAGPHVFVGAWAQLEEVIARFEDAWQQGRPPSIDEYLRADGVERPTLVTELVHTDLECRLKAGEAVRVETYLRRYPEIAADRERALTLIAAEYALRRRREPALTRDEYLGRFPQFHDDLPSRLREPVVGAPSGPPCPRCHHPLPETLAAARELTCPSCGFSFRLDAAHAAPAEEKPTRLGKFLLEGVAGRGAFGTVYRARDTELDRPVAVKVPRGDAWGSGADEERFVREARHAARLSHPGIVPVYEVGRVDGRPYLVSAFVEGETLAELLLRRRLGFREAADVVAQVADALAHAHAHRIVHRDLKPSNVLLGRLAGSDPSASAADDVKAFVTDFGLARNAEAEVVITLEGQVLGTPAYMSPEQAAGHGGKVDGRGDVYSLGVILYELLTGELPFRGVTRMLLHQILYEDPRPPRRLNDRVPRDLETVTLTCLAKEPARRYAGAALLADDLRHWLRGEPVQARPAGRGELAWRWARRNPRVAVLSAAVAGLAAALAGGGTTAALVFAQQNRELARAVADAVEATGRAEESADFARGQLDLSLETLEKLVYAVQSRLEERPGMQPLRQDLLDVAAAGLKRLADTPRGPNAGHDTAMVHRHAGELLLSLGKTDEARAEFERMSRLADELAEAHPDKSAFQYDRGAAYSRLGEISLLQGKPADALAWQAKARTVAEAHLALAPGPLARHLRMIVHNRTGLALLPTGAVAAAREEFRAGLGLANALVESDPNHREYRRDLMTSHERLGEASLLLRDLPAARTSFEQFLAMGEKLLAEDGDNLALRRDVAAARERLGDLHLVLRDFAAAEDLFGKALAERVKLAEDDPADARARRNVALARIKVGDARYQRQDYAGAAEPYRLALPECERLAAADPGSARSRRDLAIARERVGDVERHLGRPRAAREQYLAILATRENAAALDPDNAEAQTDLIAVCTNLALAELAARDHTAALPWLERGLALLTALDDAGKTKGQPQYGERRKFLQMRLDMCRLAVRAADDLAFVRAQPSVTRRRLLLQRSNVLACRGRPAEAAEAAEMLRAAAPDDARNLYEVAGCYGFCALALTPEGAEAARYRAAALKALAGAVRLGYNNVGEMESDYELESLRREPEYLALVQRLRPEPRP